MPGHWMEPMTEVGSGKGHCFLASDVSLESKEKERSEILYIR